MRFLRMGTASPSFVLAAAATALAVDCGSGATGATAGVGGAASSASSASESATISSSSSSTGGVTASSSTSSSSSGGTGGAGGSGGMPVLPWTKHFGSNQIDASWGVALNAAGDATIQGQVKAPIDFGGGLLMPSGVATNIVLAKLDANGSYVWSKIFPNTTDAFPMDILDDGLGNLVLVGFLDGTFKGQDFGGTTLTECAGYNAYVAKLDASGNHIWSTGYNGCANQPTRSVIDAAHNLVLTGANGGVVDFGTGTLVSNGGYDVMVAKIDTSTGKGIWAKEFGGVGDQVGGGVAVDFQGNVLVAGGCANGGAGIDFGGGLIPRVSIEGSWVVKLDANGNYIWSRGINNTNANQGGVDGRCIATDSQGGVIVSGDCHDDCDFGGGVVVNVPPAYSATIFLAKYDAMGTILWAKYFGTGVAGPNEVSPLAIGAGDDIYLAGFFDGTIDFGGGPLQGGPEGAFVARFDSAGNHLWSQAVQATGTSADSFRLDASQNAALYGSFAGTITFAGAFGNQQYMANDYDFYVTRFKPGP